MPASIRQARVSSESQKEIVSFNVLEYANSKAKALLVNIALLVETLASSLLPASVLRWPEILGLDAFEPIVFLLRFAKACVKRVVAIGANRLEKGSPSRGFDAPKLVHSRDLEAFWSFHIPFIGHSGQSARRRSV
jgi:hypothetical protein